MTAKKAIAVVEDAPQIPGRGQKKCSSCNKVIAAASSTCKFCNTAQTRKGPPKAAAAGGGGSSRVQPFYKQIESALLVITGAKAAQQLIDSLGGETKAKEVLALLTGETGETEPESVDDGDE